MSAHAKINLALSVGPPQPPRGYHPIASWFVPIDLRDLVTLSPLSAGAPSRYEIGWAEDALMRTPIDWPLEKDLAVRAHRLLERHAGRELPVHMDVRKNIPVGGGLGGGSSDAAAVLMAGNRLFGLGLSEEDLRQRSAELGSDVAFFIDEQGAAHGSSNVSPRGALVAGFGERIDRVATPAQQLLLFFPPFGCPTGAVYQAFDRAPTSIVDQARIRVLIDSANAAGRVDPRALFNNLAEPACVVEPRLRVVMDDLRRVLGPDIPLHITGSGSTLFALADGRRAWEVQNSCRNARPDVGVARVSLLAGTRP